jgi:hypothetical protein
MEKPGPNPLESPDDPVEPKKASKPAEIPLKRESNIIVRYDLVSDNKILKSLSEFIVVKSTSHLLKNNIVVAAPHHAESGTPLSSGHDVYTGNVAEWLAGKLGGKSVVATDLRTFIDLNKSPYENSPPGLRRHLGNLAFREAATRLKLFYQSQLFASAPSTIIEIHGHVRGTFDIEVSTGFPLKINVSQDKALIEALEAFKETLKKGLASSSYFKRSPPTVGVYPLDPEVRFAATGTHTFNKIEKLREMGVNVAGLHIELSRALRPAPKEEHAEAIYDSLVTCLGSAVQVFIDRLDVPICFDLKDAIFENLFLGSQNIELLGNSRYTLQPIAREFIGRRIAALCPNDLKSLGIMDGQPIALSSEPTFQNHIELQAIPLKSIPSGNIGIGKTHRNTLGLNKGNKVYIGLFQKSKQKQLALGYVFSIEKNSPVDVIKISDFLAQNLQLSEDSKNAATANTLHGENRLVTLEITSDVDPQAIVISDFLANSLKITFGDIVFFSTD